MSTSSRPHRIPVIGIVGGIGSGKSAVARWVAERANVLLVDADQLGHAALGFESIKTALRQRFGDQIFDPTGEVNRRALASVVFGPEESHRQARHDLEQISHPVIEQQMVDLITKAELDGREAVLLDAAVLLEAGWQHRCNAVAFVDAPDDIRWQRVAARSGWTQDELRRRESSQLPLAEKKRLSNVVISNVSNDSRGGQELLDFLCRSWGVCCKPLANSSQQF